MGCALFKLSDKQQEAATEIRKWYLGSKQTFYLAGYAGTGKTTIVNHVVDGLGEKIKPVYCAFTGKAASVLEAKGNTPACTVHSLIYRLEETQVPDPKDPTKRILTMKFTLRDLAPESFDCADNEYSNSDNENSLIDWCNLIVLDECSMISKSLYEDLLSFGKKILILGDPGQLPPIDGRSPFSAPELLLTEVHRQASDSNILTLATKARRNIQIGFCNFDDAVCAKKNQFENFYKPGYQVLCGTNNSRFKYNNLIRRELWYKTENLFPLAGEPITCLKNDRDLGLFNGQELICLEHDLMDKTPKEQAGYPYSALMKIKMVVSINGKKLNVNADFRWFKACAESDSKKLTELRKEKSEFKNSNLVGFDYAHCITCHKSQGSQWDNVIIIDESYCFRDMKAKWLYTALTRAAKKVWLLK